MTPAPRRHQLTEAALAVALAAGLSAAWAIAHWDALSLLWLPDTDDVVRLQQIRDWLAGQRFGDLTQHRMGAAGVPMHWSRLADLLPAALIALLTPLTGGASAELVAVIAWPALLFAFALMLSASLGRAVGARGADAMLVAALAYPATTLFQPGRIDHHGLQLVLLLATARAAAGAPTLAGGMAVGICTAAGLAIGMETAPLLALVAASFVLRWALLRKGADPSLAGYAAALAGGLVMAAALLRTDAWNWPACDGFDALSVTAAAIGATGLLTLSLTGRVTSDTRNRLLAVALVGLVALGAIAVTTPGCADPYGGIDPLLRRWWLARVAEATPLLASDPRAAIGYAGLMIAGLLAGGWQFRTAPSDARATVLVLQAGALALTLVQLRGAYAGALLAAPALALAIGRLRRAGALPLLAGWIASAGISYPLVASMLSRGEPPSAERCETPAALVALRRLPPGRILAPIDWSARILAGTDHRVLAGPYHRNTAGNLLLFRFLLSPPEQARAIVRRARVDYVVACPDAVRLTVPDAPAGSTARLLIAGRPPAWLVPVPDVPATFRIAERY